MTNTDPNRGQAIEIIAKVTRTVRDEADAMRRSVAQGKADIARLEKLGERS